ncbi:TPA: fimbrial assembly protein [Yersinia enterocolitica]
MKKQLIGLSVLSSLVLGMAAAHAAPPTAELKVKGKLGVPICNITAPDNGVYDLGRISAVQVKPGTTISSLPTMSKTWIVNCDSPTYLSYRAIDNRTASRSDTSSTINYGLGFINGTGKIGYYTVLVDTPTVDGKKTFMYAPGKLAGDSFYMAPSDDPYIFSNNAAIATSGKSFGINMTVIPRLAGTSTMNGSVTEDVNIDGSATIIFAFSV